MKLNKSLVACAAAAVLSATSGLVTAQPAAAGNASAQTTRILVMPRAGMDAAQLNKLFAAHGGPGRRVGKSELHILELPAGAAAAGVADKLARHPQVKFAELDRRGTLAATTNDPYLGSQWHLPKIGADIAWDTSRGAGVTIAIIDTGVDGNHPDLAASMVAGWNFVDNNANAADVMGHGTKAAGAAAATSNNALGTAGVAGQARIMPLRVTAPDGTFWYSAVAAALTYAADNGAKVANMSIYGALNSSSILSAAQYMKNKGGLVVASAGNNGRDEGWAPSTSIITVSATDSGDARPSWSSYGGFVTLAAPGVGIWTTTAGAGYGAVSGTSFSSPVTAGVVALMMATNPKLAGSDVESLLFKTAVDLGAAGRDVYFGHGRVNAGAAVQAALNALPAADTTPPTVSIAAPLASATVSGTVAIDPVTSDNVGVTKVELRVNGALRATDTAAPYGFSWDSTKSANGTATLTLTAYDAAGNASSAATASVNVANTVVADTTPPTVTITNPTNGLVGNGVTQVTALANDNSGAAGLKEQLYINGKLVASATGGSLSYNWNTRKLAAGMYTLQVVATDAAGNKTATAVQVQK